MWVELQLSFDTFHCPPSRTMVIVPVAGSPSLFPVAVSGQSGGGEVYSGAFAAMYAVDRDLRRAMAWATAAASVVVESNLILGQVSEFARNRVAARARILDGAPKAHAE